MAQHPIYLHLLGAAGTVTGSKFLLEAGKYKILIDCGLFQGLKKLRQLNWEYLPVNAAENPVIKLALKRNLLSIIIFHISQQVMILIKGNTIFSPIYSTKKS